MGPQETIERENRMRTPAAIAAILGALLIFAGTIGPQLVIGKATKTDAEKLTEFHAHASALVALSVVVAIGFALLAVPLLYLFRANTARSERVRPGFVGLMVAGPVFLAIGLIVHAIGLSNAASDFIAVKAKAVNVEKAADAIQRDSGVLQASTGLGLAGSFGICVAVFYNALWGQRTGLLNRFRGSLGMAVGVSFLLLGLIGQLFLLIWFVALGSLLLRKGSLPPAWTSGKAMPWPTPGQRAAEDMDPNVVEGRGEETSPEGSDLDPGGTDPPPVAGLPAGSKRRKRKRRGG